MTQKHMFVSETETHFRVHYDWLPRQFEFISVCHGDTFPCPSSSQHGNTFLCWSRKHISVSIKFDCTDFLSAKVSHITTRKHISVSDTETHLRVHPFWLQVWDTFQCPYSWLHTFLECIIHKLLIMTWKHISGSDAETRFRVYPIDCTDFLRA